MADPRFYRNAGPFPLARIAAELELEPLEAGGERMMCDLAAIDRAGQADVSFLASPRRGEGKRITAGAVLVSEKDRSCLPETTVALVVSFPRLAYARLAALFYPETVTTPGSVAPSAVIDPLARMGPGVSIGPQAVIGADVEIGAGTTIGAGAAIDAGVVLGRDCRIGSGCVISHTLAGDRLTALPGVRIGQSGFGFVATQNGLTRIPHLGRVIIGQDVEIGANSTVDRGTIEDTVIGDGVIIDNLVQIGHNVHIGNRCILVAQVGISGSTRLGDGVVLGGQVGLGGHLKIGDGAQVAAGSGVLRSIPEGEQWGGYPAVPVRQWHRQTVGLARMIRKRGV